MTPIERMAKAFTNANKYETRRNKYDYDTVRYEVFYHSDPDVVSPVVVSTWATQGEASAEAERMTLTDGMRAALHALAEMELPETIDDFCTEGMPEKFFRAILRNLIEERSDTDPSTREKGSMTP